MGILLSVLNTCTRRKTETRRISSSDISHPYSLSPRPLSEHISAPNIGSAHTHPSHEFGMRPHSMLVSPSNHSDSPQTSLGSFGSRGTGGKLRKPRIVDGDWDLVRQGDWPVANVESGDSRCDRGIREIEGAEEGMREERAHVALDRQVDDSVRLWKSVWPH